MQHIETLAFGIIIGCVVRLLYLLAQKYGFWLWCDSKFRKVCYFCIGGWASGILAGLIQWSLGYRPVEASILLSAIVAWIIYYQLLLNDEI